MIIYDEVEMVLNETVMAYFKDLSQHLPGQNKGNYKKKCVRLTCM